MLKSMEHLLEEIFSETSGNLRGFIFGFVHVGIMILGYYSGFSINRFLKLVSNGYVAGVFGAALSHILADVVASYLDPHIRTMIFGSRVMTANHSTCGSCWIAAAA